MSDSDSEEWDGSSDSASGGADSSEGGGSDGSENGSGSGGGGSDDGDDDLKSEGDAEEDYGAESMGTPVPSEPPDEPAAAEEAPPEPEPEPEPAPEPTPPASEAPRRPQTSIVPGQPIPIAELSPQELQRSVHRLHNARPRTATYAPLSPAVRVPREKHDAAFARLYAGGLGQLLATRVINEARVHTLDAKARDELAARTPEITEEFIRSLYDPSAGAEVRKSITASHLLRAYSTPRTLTASQTKRMSRRLYEDAARREADRDRRAKLERMVKEPVTLRLRDVARGSQRLYSNDPNAPRASGGKMVAAREKAEAKRARAIEALSQREASPASRTVKYSGREFSPDGDGGGGAAAASGGGAAVIPVGSSVSLPSIAPSGKDGAASIVGSVRSGASRGSRRSGTSSKRSRRSSKSARSRGSRKGGGSDAEGGSVASGAAGSAKSGGSGRKGSVAGSAVSKGESAKSGRSNKSAASGKSGRSAKSGASGASGDSGSSTSGEGGEDGEEV